MKAHLRRVRISPKKVNVVAGLVRGKNALEALDILKFTNKKAATFLYKALLSAVSNAENNDGKTKESLFIKEIIINKGPVFKRHVPSARGRALPLNKPTAHISIELTDKQ
jgi:large subunit ribosomal protein L22